VASTSLPAEAITIVVAQTSTVQATAAVAVEVVGIEPSHATSWPNTAIANLVNLANFPMIPVLRISAVKWAAWVAVNSGARTSADQAVMVVWVVVPALAVQAALVALAVQAALVALAVQAALVALAVQAAMAVNKWAHTPAAHSTPLIMAWDLCKTLAQK
jgi:hypothetical protein